MFFRGQLSPLFLYPDFGELPVPVEIGRKN
jgi:hypothetical protein